MLQQRKRLISDLMSDMLYQQLPVTQLIDTLNSVNVEIVAKTIYNRVSLMQKYAIKTTPTPKNWPIHTLTLKRKSQTV